MGEHLFRPTRARGRRANLALVVALVLLLSACNVWEQVGRGPGSTRFNPDETAITPGSVGSLTEAWSAQIDGGFSEPLLSGDTLYTTVGTAGGGSVRAYSAGTGALVWETSLPSPTIPGSFGPVVLAGGALWASSPGKGASFCSSLLTRLDPATGDVLGTETTGPGVIGPVVANGETVAFVTGGGCSQTGSHPQLVVRNPSAPDGNWTYNFPEAVRPASPSIGAGRIVAAAEGTVYAFDAAGCGAATCAPTWTASLDLAETNLVADGRPVVGSDGTVYVGAVSSAAETLVLALDAETGAQLWRTDLHASPGFGWQQLALADDTLYVSDHRHASGVGGAVEAFAAAGCGQPVCAPVWSASVDGPPVGGLTIGGDVLHVGEFGSGDSRLVAFDARGCGASACTRLAEVSFGDHQPLLAAVAGGRIAVVGSGASDSTLRVFFPAP